ncbi:reverse transcriptase family protein [Lysinibacillus xylanilyticus]|uniref:reverse transcriptase family protein n=1 Tax=Lysinibacillus xylanilyticus TaxID=582475 RepID=UPI00381C2B58
MNIYSGKSFYNEVFELKYQDVKTVTDSNIEENYDYLKIPKTKGYREIYCIDDSSALYVLQKNFLVNFLDYIPISENAFGFVKGRSYIDFLNTHVYKNYKNIYYLKLDLKDFFSSIKSFHIKQILEKHIYTNSSKINKEIIDDIVSLTTVDNKLPQGAVTSPSLSNIVFRFTDIRIARYCEKFGIRYSRYADDIIFSSDKKIIHAPFFINSIKKILNESNFHVNNRKTKTSIGSLTLNGFRITDKINLTRKKRAKLNTCLYICNNKKKKYVLTKLNSSGFNFSDFEDLANYLNGTRSFLIMIARSCNNNNKVIDDLIKEIELNINKFLQ